LFNVRIRTQGHDLVVEGASPDLDRVDRVVGQLSSLMRDGYKLSNADVKTASDLVAQDVAVDLRDHFLKGSLTPGGKRRIAPKTVTQRKYLDAIEQHDIVFAIGPALHFTFLKYASAEIRWAKEFDVENRPERGCTLAPAVARPVSQ